MRCCTAAPVMVACELLRDRGTSLANPSASSPRRRGPSTPEHGLSLLSGTAGLVFSWSRLRGDYTGESLLHNIWRKLALRHLVADLADAFDPDLHHIAGLEVLAPPGTDTCGSAGEDQVARMKREPGGKVRNLLGQRVDHLAGVG